MTIQRGDEFVSQQKQHPHYAVRVRGVSDNTVSFEYIRGPGKTVGQHDRMRKDPFLRRYRREGCRR